MQWEQDDIFTPEADQPSWTEEDWEHFFQEQDRRAEHYQKKFEEAYDKYKEQYSDNELSKKIQSDLNSTLNTNASGTFAPSIPDTTTFVMQEPWESAESDLELEMENAELEALPAYQYSMQFGLDTPRFI